METLLPRNAVEVPAQQALGILTHSYPQFIPSPEDLNKDPTKPPKPLWYPYHLLKLAEAVGLLSTPLSPKRGSRLAEEKDFSFAGVRSMDDSKGMADFTMMSAYFPYLNVYELSIRESLKNTDIFSIIQLELNYGSGDSFLTFIGPYRRAVFSSRGRRITIINYANAEPIDQVTETRSELQLCGFEGNDFEINQLHRFQLETDTHDQRPAGIDIEFLSVTPNSFTVNLNSHSRNSRVQLIQPNIMLPLSIDPQHE